MNRDDEESRESSRDPFGLSSDIRYLKEIMIRMMRQAFSGFEDFQIREKRVKWSPNNFNRGRSPIRVFIVKRKKNGRPKIKNFEGRMPKTPGRDEWNRDPLIDLVESDDHLLVFAHLPGIKGQGVELRVRKRRVIISVSTPSEKYHKSLELPTEVEREKYSSTYKNGVLKVRLKKA